MATEIERTQIAVLHLTGKYGAGKAAIVDGDLYDELNKYSWQCNHNGYVTRSAYMGGGSKNAAYKTLFLHKEIAKTRFDKLDKQVDHINRDLLDNRTANLRPCSYSLNQHNKGNFKTNRSGYKGVCWNKWNKKWIATTSINKKRYFLGYFTDPAAASRVYQRFITTHVKGLA